MVLSKGSEAAKEIANRYIEQCHLCIKVTIREICEEYSYQELGYGSIDSLISAVSKVLVASGFNKHQYLLGLIHGAFKLLQESCNNQSELIESIKVHLSQHRLKHTHVRDLLQEIGKKSVETPEDAKLEVLKSTVRQGFTFNYASNLVPLGYNKLIQAKHWFIHEYGGDGREAFRQYKKQHYYISPKDIIAENKDENLIKALWTVIGVIFADGCVYRTSTHLTLTESDGYYLRDYVVPTIMDSHIPGNMPLKIITQVSNTYPNSYPHSRPINKLVIEDRLFASFLNELGMEHNKIENPVVLSPKILELPDKYFFCFLSGLFDGDGCITKGSAYQAHIDFALDGETFCHQIHKQVKNRVAVRLKEYCYRKSNGRITCKLQTNTNWEAFGLVAIMLFYAPFHLKRKVKKIQSLFDSIKAVNSKLAKFTKSPGYFLREDSTESELTQYIKQLKSL